MSAATHPRIRSVQRLALVGASVVLGLYVVFAVSLSLDPGWNVLLVLIGVNSALIYAAARSATPRGRLVAMVGVGAIVTVLQPVALLACWASTPDGNGWFVPLLVAAVLAACLAGPRSTRGYAVALVVGNLNALFVAFVALVGATPPS